MSRWKMVVGVATVVVALTVSAGLAMAQQGGGGRGGRGGGGGAWDPAQMQQRMMDRMKEVMGATDEEWTIIGPRVEAVMTLQRAAGGGMGMRGMWGGRGGRGGQGGGAPAGAPTREQTPVEQASQALQTVLDNEASTPAETKAALTTYRAAREKARQELVKAQEQLREVLTLNQECRLVLMGYLD